MIQFKTDEIKSRITSTTSFDPQKNMAHINRAYQNHMEKFIPEDEFLELEAEVTEINGGEDEDMPKKKKLYRHFYDALANLGFYYSIPHLEVTIGNTGLTTVKTDGREKADARQIIRLEKSFAEAGLEHLERMIKHLDKPSDVFEFFPELLNKMNFSRLLVANADTFQRAVNIDSSFLVYQQLRPQVSHVETLELLGLIGQPKYAEIIPDMHSDNELWPLKNACISFVSLRAMADGLQMKEVGVNEKGLYQIYIENRDYGKRPVPGNTVQLKIDLLNRQADKYRALISDLVNPPGQDDPTLDLNREDSGFFHTWG